MADSGVSEEAAAALPTGMPCPGCGYDVGGIASWVCPECGRVMERADLAAFVACRDCARPEAVREGLLRLVGVWAVGLGAVTGVCVWSPLAGLVAVVVSFGGAAGCVALGAPLSRMCRGAQREAMDVVWMREVRWLAAPLPVTVGAVLAMAAVAMFTSGSRADVLLAQGLIVVTAIAWLVLCLGVLPMAWRSRFLRRARVLGVRDGRVIGLYTLVYGVCVAVSVLGWAAWGLTVLLGLAQFAHR